ncbi:hypothetical protein BC827DRAFT_1375943 [Russula dissimulans]|nr:hypothetical protein BC827DRAFT_1375943 [Russula dissimulans]
MITLAFWGHARSPRPNASDPETCARSTVATPPSSIPAPHRRTVKSNDLRAMATIIIPERSSREPPSSGGDSSEPGSASDLTSKAWYFITVAVIAAIIGVVFESWAAASPSN